MNTSAQAAFNYHYNKNKEEGFPENPDDKVQQVS